MLTHLSADFPSAVIRVVLLVWEWGRGTLSQRKIYVLLLGQRGRALCLLFNCLQLKVTCQNRPKGHILGWHILVHFTTHVSPQVHIFAHTYFCHDVIMLPGRASWQLESNCPREGDSAEREQEGPPGHQA